MYVFGLLLAAQFVRSLNIKPQQQTPKPFYQVTAAAGRTISNSAAQRNSFA